MFEIIITICLLFLSPEGDLICRCSEQVVTVEKPAAARSRVVLPKRPQPVLARTRLK